LKKILFVLGTRPEAIKLGPVISEFRSDATLNARVAVTGQHRGLLDQALDVFSIRPDHDLNVMRPGQSLFDTTSAIVAALEPVLVSERPDLVIVQGDTTTTFCAALAAFYANVPVGHVEAGLRTSDYRQPFPEEMNRVLTTRLSNLHFAPTEASAANLLKEGIAPGNVFVTGNTGIDAVLSIRDRLASGQLRSAGLPALDPSKKLVLVTAHRRESFGEGFDGICEAMLQLASRGDVELVYPVHPNPNVRRVVESKLCGVPSIQLVEPFSYVPFVDLMRRAHILLTDSGGIQEEGPSLGKPVLVMREKTERPEAIAAGTALLVGTDPARIVAETAKLLDNSAEYDRRARIQNPYGDGQASRRIREAVISF
jgi:UDP-N-acetylglucosamine 2-epimerase (non-hydrolysing)